MWQAAKSFNSFSEDAKARKKKNRKNNVHIQTSLINSNCLLYKPN